jgi:hypothetical protein
MEPQETVDLQWHSAAGTIPCRLLRLRNVTGAGLQGRTVAYFFQVNGRLASSAEDVNHAIRDPRTRYAYFLKVEATNCLVDEDRAPAMLSDFFAALVPELLRVAPRWKSAAN